MSPHRPSDPTVAYYDANAEAFVGRTRGVDMRHLYTPFLALLPKRARILDAGCGSGRDALEFMRAGHEVVACDASATMVALASKLTGLPVLQLAFQELTYQEEFDGIWACASLLHVPRREMADVLRRLKDALRPGGILFASFKYGSDEAIRDGRLFSNYDERRLRETLATRPGLVVVDIWRTNDARGVGHRRRWANALVRRPR